MENPSFFSALELLVGLAHYVSTTSRGKSFYLHISIFEQKMSKNNSFRMPTTSFLMTTGSIFWNAAYWKPSPLTISPL